MLIFLQFLVLFGFDIFVIDPIIDIRDNTNNNSNGQQSSKYNQYIDISIRRIIDGSGDNLHVYFNTNESGSSEIVIGWSIILFGIAIWFKY